ncbi:MAG: hypothetical protein KDA79_16095 [Planctomycetaceae bacterium]|nr:hypothetical protein [Planctomycetaceae bacterium]
MPTFREMTDFFVSAGADSVEHSGKTYLAHAIGVHRDLGRWGGDEDMQRAGLFHSIYGTELFQRFALPLNRRAELQELIGPRAEFLAYVNCVMDRASFDEAAQQSGGPYVVRSREIDGSVETFELGEDVFRDLCTLHLCDWLEQVARSEHWDYRRGAYRQLAERLGGVALAEYDRVFGIPARKP